MQDIDYLFFYYKQQTFHVLLQDLLKQLDQEWNSIVGITTINCS